MITINQDSSEQDGRMGVAIGRGGEVTDGGGGEGGD